MGIATGMRGIVRDIASSHRARARRLGEISRETKQTRGEAQDMIHSFGDSRQETNRQLRKDLAQDKAKMVAEVKATRNGFQNSREEMSSALKKGLAEHTQGVRSEAAKMHQGMGASHQDMSAKLRKNLARGAAARKSEAHTMLNGFQRSHKQMGVQLRKELAGYDRGIESEVSGMRQETMADMKEARTAWQGLASNMHVKSGEIKTPPKSETSTVKKENHDLETKMLAAIGEYPGGGITLAELANTLGVAPVVLGRVSNNLMKKGKIRKEEKHYFPAASESKAAQGFYYKPPLR